MFKIKGKYLNLAGFAGLFGFLGFRYFATGDPSHLFPFTFFAFFSFFIIGSINYELPDERWRMNSWRAGNAAFFVAVCSIFLIGFIAANASFAQETVIIAAIVGWIASLFTWAIAFRVYERRG